MSRPGLSTPRVRFCNGCEIALPLAHFVSTQRRCKACRAERTAQRIVEIQEDSEMRATVASLGLTRKALGVALRALGWSFRAIAVHCGVSQRTAKCWTDPKVAKDHKARRRRKGLCADCGAFAGGKSRCPKHREIHAARQR